MRSLIALIITISSVYFGFNKVTIFFGVFINKSKTSIRTDTLPDGGYFFSHRQGGNGLSNPQTSYSATPADRSVSAPVKIEGLIGQSTSTAVMSLNEPTLLNSYTVEDLIGICAFNCDD